MEQRNDHENHIGSFIIMGYSQSGKSSTINTIAGKTLAEQGNNRGISVTIKSDLYSIKNNDLGFSIDLIDTPGFNDSRLLITDDEAINFIKLWATETLCNNSLIKGFILTESLTADTIQILPNLERLNKNFGEQVNNSIVILVTKYDYIEDYEEKFEYIDSFCAEKKICLVKWSNKKNLSSEAIQNQIRELKEALNNIQPYSSKYIDQLKEEIKQIAIDLASRQPTPTQKDIIDKAKELAEMSPEVNVQKINKIMKQLDFKFPSMKEKEIHWFKRIFIGRQLEEYEMTIKKDVEALEVYSTKEKLGYDVFMQVAAETLKPKPYEYYLQEAKVIKSIEIKNKLRRS
jgi:GTP-binding protein EngB required for normal cell division